MMPATHSHSDSEDDGEYIPPTGQDASSDSETEEQQDKTPELTPEDAQEKEKARNDLWASFQASVTSTANGKPEKVKEQKMIKVQKRYLFAGEYITEVVEVPEDSPEAKKWPIYEGPSDTIIFPSTDTDNQKGNANYSTPPSIPTSDDATTISQPSGKKPGPRKRKTLLGPVPSTSFQKAKKLTTLDKSLMDWKTHTQDSVIKDELEANRKSGGYLEKVEFLQRVEDRKEDNLESLKSRKRRKL